ncbi:MAG: hypothetical protein HFACDABA_01171 [Anaerolineales bacterium]|nr:hypothetical protein [Anaerolineales bacterium]
MHRLVPDLILENYRAKKYNGSFRAVGMFLDLSGFSSLTDALMKQGQYGAEALAGLMRDIFDPLVSGIFEHGGKIVGFAGDGIMSLFPTLDDDRSAALNALAAAQMIQRRLSEHSLRTSPYGSFAFSAKIGLSLGDVSWGILHSQDEKTATYFFRGPAVEDSAAGERLARPGDVFLSHALADVLDGDVRLGEDASFHRLEGIVVPLPPPLPIHLAEIDEAAARVFVPANVLHRGERGEFRQAVNLFMRFPELSDAALRSFIHTLFELREQYGGMVTRLDFGDKGCNMLMFWGAPVAYENDIGRALNFILDLQARAGFPITAGVTYYIAHSGFIGGRLSECYTCYGWGVNLAARFMTSAPDGEIWIDERVARRVNHRFDYNQLGAQKFKGFETEQKAFTLLGRKQYIETPHQGEFVGRDAEMAQLLNFLNPLWQGRFAGVFAVWGEAGIGKSRLVYELSALPALEERRVVWAFCHSDQILQHSFNPFRYWLLGYFGFAPSMSEAARKNLFDTHLDQLIAQTADAALAGELERTRSALGSLVDLEWTDSLYARLDAEGRYNNTVIALVALFKAESLRQPLALFIEDAQFIDDDSRAFLPRLKRALSSGETIHPVAIILSSRRTGAETLFDDGLFDQSIELPPLSMEALTTLVEVELGGAISSELAQLIQERSEGNPFFVEQVLVYLQEEKCIEMSAQGWRLTKRLQEAFLSADLRSLLMARLDQLADNVRDTLQTASVLGREFDISILSVILADRPSLDSEIKAAVRAGILLPLGHARFAFTHGLLRDSAYSMQMSARRQELHFLAVEALEKIYKEEIEHHCDQLAHHAERAQLSEKARRYLALSGQQAFESYHNARAADSFTRSLAFIPDSDARARWEMLFKRMEVYKRTGDRVRHLQDIEILDALAKRIGDEELIVGALVQFAYFQFTTGEYAHCIKSVSRAFESPRLQGQVKMDAYSYWVSALLRLGRLEESMQKAEEALAEARRMGSRKAEANTLNGMGLISIEQVKLTPAMEFLNQALQIAREVGDAPVEMMTLNNMGNAAGYLGDYSLARDCYERSYLTTRERGDRYAQGLLLGNLGWMAGLQGDFPAAREYQRQSLIVAREVGNPYQEAYTLINLSQVSSMLGDAAQAVEHARLAHGICQSIGERSGEAWSLLNMGHAYLLLGDAEQAQTVYEKCLTIREEMRQPNLAAEALAGLLQIHLRGNDIQGLSQRTAELLSVVENDRDLSGTEDPLRVYFNLYLALRKLEDPRAQEHLQQAVQLLETQVSKFKSDDERQRYVENVPWRRAIQLAGRALDQG